MGELVNVVDVIAFPFQLTGDGTVNTVQQNSDVQLGQELTVLVATGVGERAVIPTFGVTPFVFTELDTAELLVKVKAFNLPVKIDSVSTLYPSPTTQSLTIEFSPRVTLPTGNELMAEVKKKKKKAKKV